MPTLPRDHCFEQFNTSSSTTSMWIKISTTTIAHESVTNLEWYTQQDT